MKQKILSVLLAGMLVMLAGGTVLAQEETSVQEEAAAQEETVTQEETAARQILGFYIANYSEAGEKVSLNTISEADLTAASEEAETVIYRFNEDGTAVLYDRGEYREGTFSYDGTSLLITAGGKEEEYDYEFVDDLLILHSGGEASALYSFALEDMNHIRIGDYSVIEIDPATVEISEEYVESYIRSILQGQQTSETITEGVTQEGDIVTISFEGILEGEEEPFEGGTSDSLTLQLGSGALIEDFEQQLTGQEIGSTVQVTITFPEDYSGEERLIGKTASFSTQILSKTVVTVPELTDEWVQTFTAEYLPEKLNNVSEFREYCRAYQEKTALHAAIFNYLAERTTITGYNGDVAQMLLNYAAMTLSSTAGYYGYDAASYAAAMGYESADAYIQTEASSYITSAMIVNKVMMDLGIRYTVEDLDNSLEDYVRSGFGSGTTAQEYKEQVGQIGMWAYNNMVFKYDTVTTALEDRVVYQGS